MYNTAPVNWQTAYETALFYMRNGIVPLLLSAPGIGKTMMADRIAQELGAKLVPVRLNSIPPEDAIGLQYVDREGQRTVNLPPSWLPAEDGTDGPIVLFFDEVTQAPDDFRKGVMSVLVERYLGQKKLPDNCYVMAAGNTVDDGTNVYELDRATASRFGIIKVRTDVESWANDYARKKGLEIATVAFLRVRQDCFEMSEEAMKGDNSIAPAPRIWEKIDPLLKSHQANPGKTPEEQLTRKAVLTTALNGMLGENVARAFISVYDEVVGLTGLADLMKMDRAERRKLSPKTMDSLWMYAQGAIWYATDVDRIAAVYGLLDDFEPVGDMPFYETRNMVGETMLQRALHRLKLDPSFIQDSRIYHYTNKWKSEANAAMAEAAAADGAGEGGVTALKVA